LIQVFSAYKIRDLQEEILAYFKGKIDETKAID